MNKKKILVIVDAQNDFIDGALENEAAKKRVDNIVNKINSFDGEFIYVTRDTHDKNYFNTKEAVNLPIIHCVKGTEGWMLNNKISDTLMKKDLSESHVVSYINKSSFESLELAKKLEEIPGKLDIEFVGFCTDICVISNVFLVKGILSDRADITVDASCCAGLTKESHNAAIIVMKNCQINVINE